MFENCLQSLLPLRNGASISSVAVSISWLIIAAWRSCLLRWFKHLSNKSTLRVSWVTITTFNTALETPMSLLTRYRECQNQPLRYFCFYQSPVSHFCRSSGLSWSNAQITLSSDKALWITPTKILSFQSPRTSFFTKAIYGFLLLCHFWTPCYRNTIVHPRVDIWVSRRHWLGWPRISIGKGFARMWKDSLLRV